MIPIRRVFIEKWWLVLFVVQLFVLILGTIFPGVVFIANDDVGILSIASGFYGKPDEHVLFTHVYLGIILKFLYELNSGWPWYDLLLQATNFASLSYAGYLVCRDHPGQKNVWIFFVLPVLGSFIYTHLHFTLTAAWAGIAGLYGLIYLVSNKSTNFLRMIIPVSMIIIANLWRMESLWAVFLVFIPVFLFRFSFSRKMRKAGLVLFLMVGTFTAGMKFLNDRYYLNDQSWEKAWKFLIARGYFTDYPAPFSRPAAAKNGWSRNDYNILRNWFWADSAVFSLEKIVAYPVNVLVLNKVHDTFPVSEEFPDMVSAEGEGFSIPPKGDPGCMSETKYIPTYERSRMQILFVPACFFIWSCFLLVRNKNDLFKILFLFFGFLILIWYLGAEKKLPPPRVIYLFGPTLLFAVWAMLKKDFSFPGLSAPFSLKVNWVLLPLTMIIFASDINASRRLVAENKVRRASGVKILNQRRLLFDKHRFVSWRGVVFAHDFYIPFQPQSDSLFRKLDISFLGSSFSTPFMEEVRKRNQLHQIAMDLFLSRDVLLFSRPNSIPLYLRFVREHYKVIIKAECIDPCFGLYKFSVIEKNPATRIIH